MYFPPQTASGSHVDVPADVQPRQGVIGAVHSHVAMNVFFSGTDLSHSNWDVEIVVNRRAEFKMMTRFKLGCGRWAKTLNTKLKLQGQVDITQKKQLDKAFTIGKKMSKVEKARIAKRTSRFKEQVDVLTATHQPFFPAQPTSVTSVCINCAHPRDMHSINGCWKNDDNDERRLCRCTWPYGYADKKPAPALAAATEPIEAEAEVKKQQEQQEQQTDMFPYLI
jgi:hypothetical protein